MKKVNKDKYDINLDKCGSFSMYSVEYKCTRLEIKVTITNIIAVNESKQKLQSSSNVSIYIH